MVEHVRCPANLFSKDTEGARHAAIFHGDFPTVGDLKAVLPIALGQRH
jgi:hypothetical protein